MGAPHHHLPAKVAVGKRTHLSIFGSDYPTPDGTGVRDYIHVVDLAKGHLAALRKLETCPGCVTYNLGTGTGYSVLDMVKAYSSACGRDLPHEMAPRRPGDVGVVYADPACAKQVTKLTPTCRLPACSAPACPYACVAWEARLDASRWRRRSSAGWRSSAWRRCAPTRGGGSPTIPTVSATRARSRRAALLQLCAGMESRRAPGCDDRSSET